MVVYNMSDAGRYHYYGIGIKETSIYFRSAYSKRALTRFVYKKSVHVVCVCTTIDTCIYNMAYCELRRVGLGVMHMIRRMVSVCKLISLSSPLLFCCFVMVV